MAGEFLSGLLQGFAQTQERRRLQEQDKKEKDARVKLFEIQLEREQRQNQTAQQQDAYRAQLLNKLSIANPSDPTSKPPSLTELLADPQNMPLLLGSGMTDIKSLAADQEKSKMMGMLQRALSGGNPAEAAAQGQPQTAMASGAPPSWQVSNIKFDTQGNPMFDLGRPEVKQWLTSQDGRTKLGVDQQGRVITTMPAGPNDRAPEDVPLPPSALSDMKDKNGNMLPPGTTLRQAQAMGAVTAPKAQEADKRATMLLGGMQDSEKTISGLNGDDTSSRVNAFMTSNPLTNQFTSEDFKKYEAAGKRWAGNYLYLVSGATKTEAEIKDTFKTYFPQPGDSVEVKQQKDQARAQEMKNISNAYASGQGALQIGSQLPAGIPPGSTQIGTSGGKPVYQSPDGKRFIVK